MVTWKELLWEMKGKWPIWAAADLSIWSLRVRQSPESSCRKFFSETSIGCLGSKVSRVLARPTSSLLPSTISSLMLAIFNLECDRKNREIKICVPNETSSKSFKSNPGQKKEGQQTQEVRNLGWELFHETKSYHDGEFFRQKVYRACQGSTLKARAQLGLEKIGLLLPLV